MKSKRLVLISLFVFLFSSSCKKDDTNDNPGSHLPTISTDSVTNVTLNEATFRGTVIKEGSSAVIARGFCWNIHPNPTVEDYYSMNAFGHGYYSHTVGDLDENTTYYLRTYATNGQGTVYGNQLIFKTKKLYAVGDQGPGGGHVFYINQFGNGLEVAPVTTEVSREWGCANKLVSAAGHGVGTGLSNTLAIINECNEPNTAARWCHDLTINGFDDWFLPSSGELDLMYKALASHGNGGFANARYWSSTEQSTTSATWHHMANSSGGVVTKSEKYLVRAIRSF